MVSLKNFTSEMSEQEYHAHSAWSYSQIARYAREGFSAITNIHNPITATAAMEFGSLLDAMLTQPEKVNDMYAVLETTPPPAEKGVLDALMLRTTDAFESVPENTIISVMDMVGYQPKWKNDTRLAKVASYAKYFNIRQSGKKIVSQQDWNDAVEMVDIIHNDVYLKDIFGQGIKNGMEYLYQMKIFFNVLVEIDGDEYVVDMKAMPDLVVVNHNDKTIQPVDLKTSSLPAYNFPDSFVKFRYDIQASIYTCALMRLRDADTSYVDYKILPYLFVDISREDKVPLVFNYDPLAEDQILGLSYGEYHYKHWTELLAEIIKYENEMAKVPSYLTLDKPNDIVSLLNRTR